jgi:hypothetical protein
MAKTTKNFKELLEHYQVRADWSLIDSNIVYPMDPSSPYRFEGYINEEDVQPFIDQVDKALNTSNVEKRIPNRIGNKYAIPYLQVGQMHTIITYFYYQHDNKTWLISLKEESKQYLG